MRDHTTLRACAMADEVARLVYQVPAGFPREEMYGLTSHMRRAAVLVPSNQVDRLKAEGVPKSRQFSAFSLNLGVSKRLGFLCNQDSLLIEPKIVETEKVLNGLIRALRDDRYTSAFSLNT